MSRSFTAARPATTVRGLIGRIIPGLLLLAGATGAQAWDACSPWYSYTYSPYVVQNSTWGSGNSGAGWWQCLWASSASNWTSEFHWLNQNGSNGYYSVKGWPAIYRGLWNSGGKIVTSDSGLPKKHNTTGNFTGSCTWQYLNTNRPRHNASYDLWVDTSAWGTSSGSNRIEVMVWQYKGGSDVNPLGTYKTNINISGSNYNVYVSQGQVSWNVVSYVRTTTTQSHTNLNLKNFTTDAAGRVSRNINDYYLQSLDWGYEIFGGDGKIQVTALSYANL